MATTRSAWNDRVTRGISEANAQQITLQLIFKKNHLATVMLVTTLCWWLYDGDRFKMLMPESLCLWFFVYSIGHQQPTAVTIKFHLQHLSWHVTNIDVARTASAFQAVSNKAYAIQKRGKWNYYVTIT